MKSIPKPKEDPKPNNETVKIGNETFNINDLLKNKNNNDSKIDLDALNELLSKMNETITEKEEKLKNLNKSKNKTDSNTTNEEDKKKDL